MQFVTKSLKYFIILVIINFSCINAEEDSKKSEISDSLKFKVSEVKGFDIPYRLDDADEKYKLPDDLDEISGIQYIKENVIACVQDEKGKIYYYDLKKDEITEKYDFADDGDYEDLEIIGDVAYVIRSDGRLYRIENFPSDDMDVKHRDLPLKSKNNVEGLCYDPATNSLLLACKDEAGIDVNLKKKRAVYSFEIDKTDFNSKPRFLIDIDVLRKITDKKNTSFQPSGIAIHPITNHIYMIATAGKLLVVLSPEGEILGVEELDKDELKQPEGITFDQQGNMYISNEARGGKGNIMLFNYQKNE
ncbi:MAG: hypothetical protein CMO01_11490 [Thalassobius sp.]|nr:hypothetical protein [Thalassovita sp.]